MRTLYIDLETTGLDPTNCQILQVGMLLDTGDEIPLDQCRATEFLVKYDHYQGQAYALWMNHKLLLELAKPTGQHRIVPAESVHAEVWQFLRSIGYKAGDHVTVGGKNVAGFDLPFLSELVGFDRDGLSQGIKWRHRTVDPAMLFMLPSDETPPNLDECLKRAGLDKKTVHTALDDCKLCAELVRIGLARQASGYDRGFAAGLQAATLSVPAFPQVPGTLPLPVRYSYNPDPLETCGPIADWADRTLPDNQMTFNFPDPDDIPF